MPEPSADRPPTERFTHAYVQLVVDELAAACEMGCSRRSSACRSHWADAQVVLIALAAAGRLLPDALTLHAQGVEYASEHANHMVNGLADPWLQEVGADRRLAQVRVETWRRTHPGDHRVVRRDSIIYVGPWVEVENTEES